MLGPKRVLLSCRRGFSSCPLRYQLLSRERRSSLDSAREDFVGEPSLGGLAAGGDSCIGDLSEIVRPALGGSCFTAGGPCLALSLSWVESR